LLQRVAEEVEAEIRQVEKELAEARHVGAKTRAGGWLQLGISCMRISGLE
jgi:hypothetical protein